MSGNGITVGDIYQAWHNTDTEWGGCADAGNASRVLSLIDDRLRLLADDEVAVKADDLRSVLADSLAMRGDEYNEYEAWSRAHDLLDAYDAAHTPQIEEPQGLGAVVEGGGRNRWIKCDKRSPMWHSPTEGWSDWSDIKATRILSEGVRLDEETGR